MEKKHVLTHAGHRGVRQVVANENGPKRQRQSFVIVRRIVAVDKAVAQNSRAR